MSDEDVEVPEADAFEQEQDAVPADEGDEEERQRESLDVPLEADEADVAEQSVGLGRADDDDYR